MQVTSNLDAAFSALADPTRRAVFERLCRREMSVSELKSGFPISQPAISQHLAALRPYRLGQPLLRSQPPAGTLGPFIVTTGRSSTLPRQAAGICAAHLVASSRSAASTR